MPKPNKYELFIEKIRPLGRDLMTVQISDGKSVFAQESAVTLREALGHAIDRIVEREEKKPQV
jgi:hypothetical protein